MGEAGDRIDSSESLQFAIDASPYGVLAMNRDGIIVLVNRELERQFGYAPGELVGQGVDVLVPEELRSVHAMHRTAFCLEGEGTRAGKGRELLGRRHDGSPFAVEIGLKTVQTLDGPMVLASIQDVTERRRTQAAQRALLEEQLEFERFVAELSVQFINLSDEQVPDVIRSALRRVGEQLALDRCTFFRIAPDGLLFDPIVWGAPGTPGIDAPQPAATRFPWVLGRLLAGEVVSFSSTAEIPDETDRAGYADLGTRSGVYVPLPVGGRVAGGMGFSTIHTERTWTPQVLHRLMVFASVFDQVLARQQRDEAVRAAALEVQRLTERLQEESVYLRREVRDRLGGTDVVGQSAAVRRVMEQIHQVASTDATVLLLGETGTGKELFATQIHELGARRGRPMVRVNCAAIPATLIESELFGREKGAYTGALARQVGRFELADRSTIFLDEIGDLPADVQVKLLRVLEERHIERLGSPRSIAIDARIIAATHRNLEQRIAEGSFREDLYYRLNVFPIHVPPLRERAEDIPLLVWRFVEEFSKAFGKRIESIDKDSLAALQDYSWPGNIRELRHIVERAMITVTGRRLTIALPQTSAASTRRSSKLIDVEKDHIRSVLEATGWRIRGAGGAADKLGLKPTTLETRMQKLGLKRPRHA